MINPARLQQARELRGWTQTVLAQQVECTNRRSHSSRRVGCSRAPRSWTPSAGPQGSRPAFFTRPSGPAFPLGSLRFRARAAMTARQRRQAWWYAHTLA